MRLSQYDNKFFHHHQLILLSESRKKDVYKLPLSSHESNGVGGKRQWVEWWVVKEKRYIFVYLLAKTRVITIIFGVVFDKEMIAVEGSGKHNLINLSCFKPTLLTFLFMIDVSTTTSIIFHVTKSFK